MTGRAEFDELEVNNEGPTAFEELGVAAFGDADTGGVGVVVPEVVAAEFFPREASISEESSGRRLTLPVISLRPDSHIGGFGIAGVVVVGRILHVDMVLRKQLDEIAIRKLVSSILLHVDDQQQRPTTPKASRYQTRLELMAGLRLSAGLRGGSLGFSMRC